MDENSPELAINVAFGNAQTTAPVTIRSDEQELFQKALFLFLMLSRKSEMRTVGPIVEFVRISQRTFYKKKNIQKRKGKTHM